MLKSFGSLAAVLLLLQGVWSVDTPINVSWTFSGDQIAVSLPSSVTCSSTFNKGRANLATCSDTTSFVGAKKTSETSFNLLVASTAVNSGNGGFQGATGPETYGTNASDNTSILDDSTVGNGIAAAIVAGNAAVSTFAQLLGAAQLIQPETAASETMTVRIYNNVLTTWTRSLTSADMTAFSTSVAGDLVPDSTVDLTITFGSTGTPTGSLTYTSGGHSFVISASLNGSTKEVKINWNQLSIVDDFFLFPPQFAVNTAQNLGFRPNGIYNVGIFRPGTLTNTAQGTKTDPDYRKTWMKDYAHFLGSYKMFEIILPGTHDAVSAKFSHPILDYYFQTQSSVNFLIVPQLNFGVRSFDLRIGETAAGAFIGVHDKQAVVDASASEYTLAEILDDFQTFTTTAGNDGEIVVLGFHRFVPQTGVTTFNQAGAQAILTGHNVVTTDRLIPEASSSMTYSQLIAASTTQRLICAWRDNSKPTQCWTGVAQQFAGDTVFNLDNMLNFFTSTFTAPATALRAAQAAINVLDAGPVWFEYELERYFSTAAIFPNINIIHSDFIDSSYMVETAIALNLAKVTGAQAGSGAVHLAAGILASVGLSLLLLF